MSRRRPTGIYWKPVWHVLSVLGFMLITGQCGACQERAGPQDRCADAAWLSSCWRTVLIRASFVPDPPTHGHARPVPQAQAAGARACQPCPPHPEDAGGRQCQARLGADRHHGHPAAPASGADRQRARSATARGLGRSAAFGARAGLGRCSHLRMAVQLQISSSTGPMPSRATPELTPRCAARPRSPRPLNISVTIYCVTCWPAYATPEIELGKPVDAAGTCRCWACRHAHDQAAGKSPHDTRRAHVKRTLAQSRP